MGTEKIAPVPQDVDKRAGCLSTFSSAIACSVATWAFLPAASGLAGSRLSMRCRSRLCWPLKPALAPQAIRPGQETPGNGFSSCKRADADVDDQVEALVGCVSSAGSKTRASSACGNSKQTPSTVRS